MTNLGQYTLQEELGRGGSATVYRATHGALGNQVAIKVLSPELSGDENARKRFTQEAQIASALEHPNIVRILDLDDDRGQIYIAMDYVSGGNLKKRSTEPGSLSQEGILHILGQVAEALDYAHSKGVLHRNIKPANILLAQDGSAHLCDFSLISLADASQPIPLLGSMVDTASYISPEMAEGKTLDGRADQYALVVVAYELLAGNLPFAGGSSTATALLHITRQPPDPCSFNPHLTGEVSEVLLKGLAKDPSQRYATCCEFSQTLATALESSQLRQYRELLAQSRSLLEVGKLGEARASLDSASKLLPDRPELLDAISEIEAASQSASQSAKNYEQVLTSWQTAQQNAKDVLALFPDYPDPLGIFAALDLRKPGWSLPGLRELALQVGLGLVLGLSLLSLVLNLAFRWITR